jgi:hypothetical protein
LNQKIALLNSSNSDFQIEKQEINKRFLDQIEKITKENQTKDGLI